jgi:hypothetical protein
MWAAYLYLTEEEGFEGKPHEKFLCEILISDFWQVPINFKFKFYILNKMMQNFKINWYSFQFLVINVLPG